MTNDPGNAQPPVVGWLEPYEWQKTPMNGDSDECVPGEEDSECVFAGDASDFDDEGIFTL
jgi:hypothetical protein